MGMVFLHAWYGERPATVDFVLCGSRHIGISKDKNLWVAEYPISWQCGIESKTGRSADAFLRSYSCSDGYNALFVSGKYFRIYKDAAKKISRYNLYLKYNVN